MAMERAAWNAPGVHAVDADAVAVVVDDLAHGVGESEQSASVQTISKTDFWTRRPYSSQSLAIWRSRRRPSGDSVLTS